MKPFRRRKARFSPAHAGNTNRQLARRDPPPVQPRACGEHDQRRETNPPTTGSAPRMRGTRAVGAFRAGSDRFSPAHAGNTGASTTSRAAATVQPRACGEHVDGVDRRRRMPGSAPRMRGTHLARRDPGRDVRFSPAHAGNTSDAPAPVTSISVQPRACGEHPELGECLVVTVGSAPRMRGTRALFVRDLRRDRFSPAHAGNTLFAERDQRVNSVQPRACGEHGHSSTTHQRTSGSAPRMRGTHRVGAAESDGRRFSPAHAGNTPPSASAAPIGSVQPRACGEHALTGREAATDLGSAPRMRGTHAIAANSPGRRRFSPAHAGNTPLRRGELSEVTVQPRACGEHEFPAVFWPDTHGSAPRMRGTLGSALGGIGNARFSPAHAGNTPLETRRRVPTPVQPRACGEHARAASIAAGMSGSAPRMRGTPRSRPRSGRPWRFSPAHAGNTSP